VSFWTTHFRDLTPESQICIHGFLCVKFSPRLVIHIVSLCNLLERPLFCQFFSLIFCLIYLRCVRYGSCVNRNHIGQDARRGGVKSSHRPESGNPTQQILHRPPRWWMCVRGSPNKAAHRCVANQRGCHPQHHRPSSRDATAWATSRCIRAGPRHSPPPWLQWRCHSTAR
jgi:ferredoxin